MKSASGGGLSAGASVDVAPAEARPDAEAEPVLTIGHSTRTFEQFAGLLSENEVGHLVEVRRFPFSPRHPQFDEGALSEKLVEAGIGYLHLPELGGRRRSLPGSPNIGWRNTSFRGYADHMASAEFRTGFERLVELCGGEERVCLMCSEAVWWRRHRRMISDALLVRGFRVEHILGERRRTVHEITSWARVISEELIYPGE